MSNGIPQGLSGTASPELVAVIAGAIRSFGPDAEAIAADVERFLDGDGHAVVFHEDGWFTEHTVACRLVGMENCAIHAAVDSEVSRTRGPILPLGRYLASIDPATGLRLAESASGTQVSP